MDGRSPRCGWGASLSLGSVCVCVSCVPSGSGTKSFSRWNSSITRNARAARLPPGVLTALEQSKRSRRIRRSRVRRGGRVSETGLHLTQKMGVYSTVRAYDGPLDMGEVGLP